MLIDAALYRYQDECDIYKNMFDAIVFIFTIEHKASTKVTNASKIDKKDNDLVNNGGSRSFLDYNTNKNNEGQQAHAGDAKPNFFSNVVSKSRKILEQKEEINYLSPKVKENMKSYASIEPNPADYRDAHIAEAKSKKNIKNPKGNSHKDKTYIQEVRKALPNVIKKAFYYLKKLCRMMREKLASNRSKFIKNEKNLSILVTTPIRALTLMIQYTKSEYLMKQGISFLDELKKIEDIKKSGKGLSQLEELLHARKNNYNLEEKKYQEAILSSFMNMDKGKGKGAGSNPNIPVVDLVDSSVSFYSSRDGNSLDSYDVKEMIENIFVEECYPVISKNIGVLKIFKDDPKSINI